MEFFNFLGENFWALCAIIMTSTTLLTGWIFSKIETENKWVKRIVSWVIAIALACGACAGGSFTPTNPEWLVWLKAIATGLFIGGSANGFYSIDEIKTLIKSITGEK